MVRKTKKRRKKKGGYASDWNPSPDQRAAMRHGIDVQTYRRYVREYLMENAADGSVNNVQPSQDILDEFIRRRIVEEREEEDRALEFARLAEIRGRAQYREAEQAREEARRQADIRARTVHRFIENPDGSIDLGSTVAPTEEQAKAMEIHNIAQEEGLSWMNAYRRYNEIHNINTNEIPVTRPSRLRRIRDYIIGLRDRIRERRVFGRRNRTSVVPAAPPQLGGKKRRKKTRRKKRRGGNGTKRKREGPPTPKRPPRRRPNPQQQQQPQQNQDDDYDEYAALMEHIEANVDPDDPNFVQGGGKRNKRGNGGVFSRRRKNISIKDPKEKYINLALKKLITDPEWENAGVVAQVKMMRNLAIQLEEEDKKGGRRRKKKTIRKKNKKKKKTRKKKGRGQNLCHAVYK